MNRIIIIVYLLSLGGIIHAQDTLTALKPSWFYNYHSPIRPTLQTGVVRNGFCDVTKVFCTDQPRYIYGVAVAVHTLGGVEYTWSNLTDEEKEYYCNLVEDTTLAHCEEFIRAYEKNKDTINILREALCNITTPPSYYLEIPDSVAPHWMPEKYWRIRIHEIYFDDPLLVMDSFYVGMSQYLPKKNSSADKWPVWPMVPVLSEMPRNIPEGLHYPFNILFSPDSNCSQWYYSDELPRGTNPYASTLNNLTCRDLWFFPIVDSGSWNPPHWEGIAPLPSVPTVTVGPNPTTGKLSVHSEHVISYIDIYDSHGELVDIHNTRALSCELDLSALPTGVYFLHLYTSGGTVSKRVIKIDS